MAPNPRVVVVGLVVVAVVGGLVTTLLGLPVPGLLGGSSANGTATPTVTAGTPAATATPETTGTAAPTPAATGTAEPGTGPATAAATPDSGTRTPTPTPTPADSDGDGLHDDREAELGTDPDDADTDDDGVDDGGELESGTDPLTADTDADGLADGTELGGVTDPLVADTDEDGLDDGLEGEFETDPRVADTDADGLDDGKEVDRGTSPTSADTDADGLLDPVELAGPTSAIDPDTDDDEVDDGRERAGGTSATDPDTDSDQLLDGWERDGRVPDGPRLPNASATHKDLYVQVNYGFFTTQFTERELGIIEEQFAHMPVDNPDGDPGITLHVDAEQPRGGLLNDSVEVTNSGGSFESVRDTYYNESHMGNRTGVYHLIVVGQLDTGGDARPVGFAEAPGLFGVVNEAVKTAFLGDTPARERVVIHELLHNLVGDFTVANDTDGEFYHVSGTTVPGSQAYLSGPASKIPRGESEWDSQWNLSFATIRELDGVGFKSPSGRRFPTVQRSQYGPAVVAMALGDPLRRKSADRTAVERAGTTRRESVDYRAVHEL